MDIVPAVSELREGFTLSVEITMRTATPADLSNLEWYGLYTPHRAIIRATFEQQERGEGLMLLAVFRDFPVGQAWLDLARKAARGGALMWAVRVYPFFQGFGIGGRLLTAAERALRQRGFAWVEVEVEKDNPGVRRFYERLGYRAVGEDQVAFGYTNPAGQWVREEMDVSVLRKQLDAVGPEARPPGQPAGERRVR